MSSESDYQRVFDVRGHSYHEAMQLCPKAREREFAQLFTDIDVSKLKTVLDIPAGGGYLKHYLPAACELDSMEPCAGFKSLEGASVIDLEALSLPHSHYDAVICLAALHHINNKQRFIDSLIAATRVGGNVLIADVNKGSGEAAFLDEFASQYNQTGHSGLYLSIDEVPQYIEGVSCAVLVTHQLRNCQWSFDSKAAMLRFCRLLFGLVDVSDNAILEALSDFVGVSYRDEAVYLEWALLYIHINRIDAE